ncbi:MAG: NAD(P)H-dependent oxidoreductase subunit E [bacterium]|nr:NAD(P)H-dependent oxidoreductase subunit E [bacterium]
MKCKDCAELYRQLDEVIEQNKHLPGPIIQTLHGAQKIFGYLPREVLEYVANKLGHPVSEVYGVATFYHLFHLKPKGLFQFKVCLGTACYIRGGPMIVDQLKAELGIGLDEVSEDRMFSVEAVRCIGACGLAPAMMVNDKVYDRLISPAKVRAVINHYRALAAEHQRTSA